MIEWTCPHGHGIWHWVVDVGMTFPFIAFGWWWLKSKFQRGKDELSND